MTSKVQHSEACCNLPPFTGSTYKPTGKIERIEGSDVDVYLTGKKGSEIALVCIYDIFGIQVPTQQGADILAHQLGARIATPDLFRGKPWELSKFPPPDRDEFLGWIGKYQWPAIEPDLLKTIGLLREEGAKHIGVYGFCWGGKQVVNSVKLFKAAAVVHPAFLEVSDADKISVPFALIDSEDEPKETMDELYSVLEKKPFADKNFRHRYEIFHGFCAGRANYEDPKNGKLAREAYADLCNFFHKNLA